MDFTFQEYIGILSILVSLTGTGIYISSILRKKTKPHLYTWLTWTILPAIGFFAQRHGQAGPGAWASGTGAFASFIIVCLAFKYGEKHKTNSDRIALIVSLLAIIPWIVTKDPLGSVILISLIDLIAFFPTFRKSWSKPFQENLLNYTISALAMMLSLFAMHKFTLTTLLYPFAFVIGNFGFVLFCLWRRYCLRGQKQLTQSEV
jgi:hypothetical protein